MSFAYTVGKVGVLNGTIDLLTDTIKARMVMSNTTCDTEVNVATMAAFTTLDTFNGSSYADITLGTKAVNTDTSNSRAEFDCADWSWGTLGAGSRQVVGVVLYKFVTNDSDSIPICYLDSGLPITATGTVTTTINAEGLVQL